MGYNNLNQSECGVAILDGNNNAAHNLIVGLHRKKPIEAQHTNTSTSPLHVVLLQNLPNPWWWRETSFITNTRHTCEWALYILIEQITNAPSLHKIIKMEHCMTGRRTI
jgi:hypothetical protein